MFAELTVAALTADEKTISMGAFSCTPMAPDAGVIAVTVSGVVVVVGVDGVDGADGEFGVLLIVVLAPPHPAIKRDRNTSEQVESLAKLMSRTMHHHRVSSLDTMPQAAAKVCWMELR